MQRELEVNVWTKWTFKYCNGRMDKVCVRPSDPSEWRTVATICFEEKCCSDENLFGRQFNMEKHCHWYEGEWIKFTTGLTRRNMISSKMKKEMTWSRWVMQNVTQRQAERSLFKRLYCIPTLYNSVQDLHYILYMDPDLIVDLRWCNSW